MNVEDLIAEEPQLHCADGRLTSRWKLGDEELRFLDRHLQPGMKTVETGAGVSTLVFLVKGTDHLSIVPDEALSHRILDYCHDHTIDLSRLRFLYDSSEFALPSLEEYDFDLALIDGRHGFPTPFLDWYYLAIRLKVGGLLIVDDIHIWTCETLFRFLDADPDWKLVEESLSAVAFQKLGDSHGREWNQQRFVAAESRQGSVAAKLRYLRGLMKRRNWQLLGEAVRLGLSSAFRGGFGTRDRR